MSHRNYPDWVEACVQAQKGTKLSKVYRRWSAVSAVAGALGRRCWYEQGLFRIWPNLFIVLIGRPAVGKSLSTHLPMMIFNRLCSPIFGTEFEKKAAEVSWRRYIGGPSHVPDREQGLYPLYIIKDRLKPEALSWVCGNFVRRPVMSRSGIDPLLDKDGTQLYDSSVTLVTDEFGTFMSRHDAYLQALLTSAWDGKTAEERILKTDKAHGDNIRGFCLNWLGGAVHAAFIEHLPVSAGEQGLLSRIIPVLDPEARPVYEARVSGFTVDDVDVLAEDLGQIAALRGEFKPTGELLEVMQAWLDNGRKPEPTDPLMEEYCGRRFSHLVKLTMTYSAAGRSDLTLRVDDWDKACALLFAAEKHMPAILLRFGQGPVGKMAIDLTELVRRKGGVVRAATLKQEALRLCRSSSEVAEVINLMVEAEMIHREDAYYRLPKE